MHSGEVGGPQCLRFKNAGTVDRGAENVSQELHGPLRYGHATIDAQHRIGAGAGPVSPHGFQQVAGLVANAFQGGAGEFGRARAPGYAEQGAARLCIPIRGAEPDEGGNQNDVLVCVRVTLSTAE